MQRETTKVRLRITSATMTAAAIEEKLGIKADESWKVGDLSGTFGAILKDHGYALDAVAPYTIKLEDHLRAMIKRIAPVAQKIGEISGEAKVEMVCTMFCKAAPPIAFSRDDLRWIAAIGGSLDVEVGMLVERAQPASAERKPGDKEGPASVF